MKILWLTSQGKYILTVDVVAVLYWEGLPYIYMVTPESFGVLPYMEAVPYMHGTGAIYRSSNLAIGAFGPPAGQNEPTPRPESQNPQRGRKFRPFLRGFFDF